MLEIRPLALDGVFEIVPPRFSDDRGFFSEIWSREAWQKAGIDIEFVQDNLSLSLRRGTLRGLHFQSPPYAQDKLVRVTRGEVFDVAVDIRSGSRTFGKWTAATLSAAKGNQLLVTKGFAHGFVTLEPDTEVQYKVSAPYSREHDRAVRFDDPAIGIDWPFDRSAIILSDKDRDAPRLQDVESGF